MIKKHILQILNVQDVKKVRLIICYWLLESIKKWRKNKVATRIWIEEKEKHYENKNFKKAIINAENLLRRFKIPLFICKNSAIHNDYYFSYTAEELKIYRGNFEKKWVRIILIII